MKHRKALNAILSAVIVIAGLWLVQRLVMPKYVDGIVEGYAVYVMYEALAYLEHLSDAERAIATMNDKLSYLVCSSVDIGIHYY
ncbi:MAG: hypothetical protein IJT94_10440, partial [Oscillibacter sp.]|nr:hypothetical protein [Oscillibacter sp.]